MFIFNVKVNGNKLGKALLAILIIIILIVTGIVCYNLFTKSRFKTNDAYNKNVVYELSPQNYANVLQTVHNNIDDYVGQKINFSGYIYRIFDFTEKQFVLARDMIVSSDFQTVVVGFLCECNDAKTYKDNEWVELEGEIVKGDYHGDMPIIKVTYINRIDIPNEEIVYPPDSSFVQTSTVL